MEDEAAVLSVQLGIRSRFYAGGRYSPTHERGVHHFHRLLAEVLDQR
jgi:choline monooxygenase